MKRYFITGTDTDCGKTYVTTRLLDFFPNSVAIKPVASGCRYIDNQLVSDDAQQLQYKSNISMDQINPWRFELPISPHLAASKENKRLDLNKIAEYCMRFETADKDTLFIEGAGGLFAPLTPHETWLDFLKRTQIPVILVVGMKLGCINHALLTECALKVNHIDCAGWIANCIDEKMLALEENIETLTHLLSMKHLATVPHLGTIVKMSWQ